MATTSTTQAAAQLAALSDMSDAPTGFFGSLHLMETTITTAAAYTAADTISLFYLPAGACVVPQLSTINFASTPGTTLTYDIGPASNPDAYADALTVSGATTVYWGNSATVPLQNTAPERLTTTTLISATIVTPGPTSPLAVAACFRCVYWLPH